MPRSRYLVALGSLLLAGALTTGDARATQILLQTVEQMTYRSDAVVRAVPIANRAETRWSNPNGTGLILTRTPFRVIESLQGTTAPGQEVMVEHLGGTVGDISMMVPGCPIFRADEEVLLFLQRGPDGDLQVLDLSMGKFEVGASLKGGRTLSRRDLEDGEAIGGGTFPATLEAMRASVTRAGTRKAELLRSGRPLPDLGSTRDEVKEGGR